MKRFERISMSLPPMGMARIEPMNPEIEKRPRNSVSWLYGDSLKDRYDFSCTMVFLEAVSENL